MVRIYGKKLAAVIGFSSLAIAATGLAVRADVRSADLSSGESEVYKGYFLANEDIYASCDANCEDLDIYLYDAYTEELIESDTLADANPVVTAPYDGEFLVETVMVVCTVDTCEAWTDSDAGF